MTKSNYVQIKVWQTIKVGQLGLIGGISFSLYSQCFNLYSKNYVRLRTAHQIEYLMRCLSC